MKKLIALLFGVSVAAVTAFAGCGKELDSSLLAGPGQEGQAGENCTNRGCFWLLTPDHPAWDRLDNGVNPPNGTSTVFYRSGLTYQQVLIRPSNDEAYFFAAYHFIAAQLNKVNGADTTDIDGTLQTMSHDFELYGPGDVANDAALDNAFRNAGFELMAFNTGEIGPGTCTCDVAGLPVRATHEALASTASTMAVDAGAPPPIDAPPPPSDGGTGPDVDAGVPEIDAGVPEIDAGVPEACVCIDGPDHT